MTQETGTMLYQPPQNDSNHAIAIVFVVYVTNCYIHTCTEWKVINLLKKCKKLNVTLIFPITGPWKPNFYHLTYNL